MGYWRSLTSYMYYSLVCIFGSFIKHSWFVKKRNFFDLRSSFYFGREVRRKSTRNYYNHLTWYVFFLFTTEEYIDCRFRFNDSLWGRIFFFSHRLSWFTCFNWNSIFNLLSNFYLISKKI